MKSLGLLAWCSAVQILVPTLVLGQPKLDIVGGTKFSFGNIFATSKVQKAISLKNNGTDTLFISDVAAACGCTGAMVSNSRIAPGDKGLLSITFDPGHFNGWVEKTVGFKSNDPAKPYSSIAFTANVIKVLEVDPEYVIFSHAKVDSEMAQEVTIKNISPKHLRLSSVKTSSEILSARLIDSVLAPNQTTSLVCNLFSKKAGTFSGNIEFSTDNPQIPVCNIRFFAFLKSTVLSQPIK